MCASSLGFDANTSKSALQVRRVFPRKAARAQRVVAFGVWECPNLFPMTFGEGAAKKIRWVLIR